VIDADRERVREMLAWAFALICCLIALILAACGNTSVALEQLPVGYGEATWRLVEAVALDVWAVLEWAVGLIL